MGYEVITMDTLIDLATPILTVAGGCIAFLKWRRDKAVDRAAQLAKLRTQFYSFKPDVLLQKMGGTEQEDNAAQDMNDQVRRKAFFSFLAHICYLRETKVISEKEFCVFKWQIVNILELECVLDSISSLYAKVESRKDVDKPFYSLVKYGAMNCSPKVREHYLKLGKDKEVPVSDSGLSKVSESPFVASVGDGVIYRTHLDVLNGIFDLGYLGHMRGLAQLPNGYKVWFPEIEERATPSVPMERERWHNILQPDGMKIIEYSILDKNIWNGDSGPRYVFGKYKQQNRVEYRFLGVFRPAEGNNGINQQELSRTYERIRATISASDVADASGKIME